MARSAASAVIRPPLDLAQTDGYLEARLVQAPRRGIRHIAVGLIHGLGQVLGVIYTAVHTYGVPHNWISQNFMMHYLRNGDEIYRQSFAIIRAEAPLDRLPPDLAEVAVRLIHACGMTDIVADLVATPDAVSAGRTALRAGAPILCDTRMVAEGIIRNRLPAQNAVLCTLQHPEVPAIAARLGNTRSAAALELWQTHLGGAVVAIGNAPTALFRLLELLDAGAAKPALIVGLPVGFVGAAEAKAALASDSRGVPFLTLRGRRGGSAMAAAAINALARQGV